SEHYRLLHAKRLIDGLVHCADCIARKETKTRLHISGHPVKRMGCPRHKTGACPMIARVPYAAAEQAVNGVIQDVLVNYPEFVAAALARMRDAIREMASGVPAELET